MCFFDFLFECFKLNPRWVCIIEEIKAKFSQYFDLKIDNENLINWEIIPESPLMTSTNPEYRKEEFNIEEICSKI